MCRVSSCGECRARFYYGGEDVTDECEQVALHVSGDNVMCCINARNQKRQNAPCPVLTVCNHSTVRGAQEAVRFHIHARPWTRSHIRIPRHLTDKLMLLLAMAQSELRISANAYPTTVSMSVHVWQ